MVVLIFIIYTKRKKPDKLIVGVDPGDDVRENIINYDEEGVGKLIYYYIVKCLNQDRLELFMKLSAHNPS